MRSLFILLSALLALIAFAQSPAEALRSPAKRITAAEIPDAFRAVAIGESGSSSGMSFLTLFGIGDRGGSDAGPMSLMVVLMGVTFVDPDEFARLLEGKLPRIRGYALDYSSPITEPVPPRSTFPKKSAPASSRVWVR